MENSNKKTGVEFMINYGIKALNDWAYVSPLIEAIREQNKDDYEMFKSVIDLIESEADKHKLNLIKAIHNNLNNYDSEAIDMIDKAAWILLNYSEMAEKFTTENGWSRGEDYQDLYSIATNADGFRHINIRE